MAIAITWRVGMFRLAILAWILGCGVLGLGSVDSSVDLPGIALAAKTVAIFTLSFWTAYCAVLWLASGLGVTAPINPIGAAAVALASLLLLFAGAMLERHATRARLVQEGLERVSRTSEAWQPTHVDELEQEEARQEHAVFVDHRVQEILDEYPAGAKDLTRDGPGAAGNRGPRAPGEYDAVWDHPETIPEYLEACAEMWPRWKCANAAAQFEYGKLEPEGTR